MTHRTIRLTGLVVSGLLLSLAWLLLLQPSSSAESALAGPQGCQRIHVVQPGDTLATIAEQYDVAAAEIIRLNAGRIPASGAIWVGLRLCLPTARAEAAASVLLQVEYVYDPTPQEQKTNIATARGGLLGQRLVYPLAADGVRLSPSLPALQGAIEAGPGPLFYGVRNGGSNAYTYTLALPAQGDILTVLTSLGSCSVPVAEALSVPGVKEVSALMALETGAGVQQPFSITHVSKLSGASLSHECLGRQLAFALRPAGPAHSEQYELLLLQPGAPADADGEQAAANDVAVEVSYRVQAGDDGDDLEALSPSGVMNKRTVYPLGSIGGLVAVTGTQDVVDTLLASPPPLLIGIRNRDNPGYKLAAIGGAEVFSSLLLSDDQPINLPFDCDPVEVAGALGDAQAESLALTVFLESETSLRFPFHVTHLDWVLDGDEADSCYVGEEVAFALLPAEDGQHQFVVIMTEDEFGPAGAVRTASCRRWRQGRGLVYRFLRAVFGCSRY